MRACCRIFFFFSFLTRSDNHSLWGASTFFNAPRMPFSTDSPMDVRGLVNSPDAMRSSSVLACTGTTARRPLIPMTPRLHRARHLQCGRRQLKRLFGRADGRWQPPRRTRRSVVCHQCRECSSMAGRVNRLARRSLQEHSSVRLCHLRVPRMTDEITCIHQTSPLPIWKVS